jgi:hypothetical protein
MPDVRLLQDSLEKEMPVELRSLGPSGEIRVWTLDRDGDSAILLDSGGQSVMKLTPREIVAAFQMPSFSRSIKYFGIVVEGKVLQYDVSRRDLKKLKAIVERALVISGPEHVRRVRNVAVRDTAVGLALATVGTILTVISFRGHE